MLNRLNLGVGGSLLVAATTLLSGCGEAGPVSEEKAAGSTSQALTPARGGMAFALVARHSGQCLDVDSGSLADGANVRQWSCNGLTAQSFRFETLNDGYFYLINVNSGKALEVAGGLTGDGANVDQGTKTSASYQQFQLQPTTDGWYKITARHSGKALKVAGCSTTTGANVEQNTFAGLQCQEWRLQPVGNVKVINKATGKVVGVDSALTTDNANVHTLTYAPQDHMHFSFSHVSDGYYRMTPVHSGKAVEVSGCSVADAGNVAQYSWLANNCQQWRISLGTDGYAQLVNRNSGKVMDVASCLVADKTNIQQYANLSNDCQRFRLESAGVSYDAALDTQAHDPHIINQGSYYYLTTTGGTIAIRRSTDQLHWSSVGNAFSAVPAWVNTRLGTTITDLWAPDIAYFGGKYWLYYSGSVFGTNTSVIGVASSPTLDPAGAGYGWVDQGLVIATTSSNNYNAIDPDVTLDASGVPWLAFGSFWTGIKMRQIDPATGKLSSANTTLYSLAQRSGTGAVEGPSIMRANGYYYLFVSYDSCCKGADSTYRTMVGRATSITGPYVDSAGSAMTSGNAMQLLSGIDHVRGPGGGAAYFVGSTPYFANHFYDSTDYAVAKLQVRPVTWSNNWPVLGAPIP
jgi:arabinan endo-1,5-alpha-L-arabinosidase